MCKKKMYYTYNSVGDGEKIFMGNSTTSKVEGNGKIVLKMTMGQNILL